MRQLSDINVEAKAHDRIVATISLRTPDLAGALNTGRRTTAAAAWALGSILLMAAAWYGAFGQSTRAFIWLTVAVALLYWFIDLVENLFRERSRLAPHLLTVDFKADRIDVVTPERKSITVPRSDADIRFSSRPDWRGRQEERDERRVGHAIGYELRDGWEVWCEAGLDVFVIAAVSHEDDARKIVRHLSEANLRVTRPSSFDDLLPKRAEPA